MNAMDSTTEEQLWGDLEQSLYQESNDAQHSSPNSIALLPAESPKLAQSSVIPSASLHLEHRNLLESHPPHPAVSNPQG
jgi:hypothetical protein